MQAIQANIHEFPKGTTIIGQTNKRRYTIKKQLSKNATGTMYLCTCRGKKYVLKLSRVASLLTKEINILTALGKVRDQTFGPCLVDVDEWPLKHGSTYAFYVMTYIKGETIDRFIEKHQRHWLPLFVVKLLQQLEIIHQTGYIYGNFTMRDLVVTKDLQICPIHLNHVTKIGHPITVHSNFFDRSFWMLGSRIATPNYDLFVIVMATLRIFYQKQFHPTDEPASQLMNKINKLSIGKPYKQCFLKAILGKYNEAGEMKEEFLQAIIVVEDYPLFSKKSVIKHGRTTLGEINGLLLLSLAYFLSGYFLN